MRQRSARGVNRGGLSGTRRTPWTPLFDSPTKWGAIDLGGTPIGAPPAPQIAYYGTGSGGANCFEVEVGDVIIGCQNYRDDNVNISGPSYPATDPLCPITATYTLIDSDYVWYDVGGNDARCTWKVWVVTGAGIFGLTQTVPSSYSHALHIKYTDATVVQSDRVNLESSGITSFSQSLPSAPTGLSVVVTNLAGNASNGTVTFAGGLTKLFNTGSANMTTAVAYGIGAQVADPSGWDASYTTFGGYASRMWEFGLL